MDADIKNSAFDKDRWLLKTEAALSDLGIPFTVVSFIVLSCSPSFNNSLSKRILQGEVSVNKVHKLLALYLTPYAPYSADDKTISTLTTSIKNSLYYDNYDDAYDSLKISLQGPDMFKNYIDSTIRIYGNDESLIDNHNYYQLVSKLLNTMEEEDRETLVKRWEIREKFKEVKQIRVQQKIPSSAQILANYSHFPCVTLKTKGLAKDNQIQVGIMNTSDIQVQTKHTFTFNPLLAPFPVNMYCEKDFTYKRIRTIYHCIPKNFSKHAADILLILPSETSKWDISLPLRLSIEQKLNKKLQNNLKTRQEVIKCLYDILSKSLLDFYSENIYKDLQLYIKNGYLPHL